MINCSAATSIPQQVKALVGIKVERVACGAHHTIACDDNGKVQLLDVCTYLLSLRCGPGDTTIRDNWV